MKVDERFDNISSQGDTVNFCTCKTCFAAVMRQDKAEHNDWHNREEANDSRRSN